MKEVSEDQNKPLNIKENKDSEKAEEISSIYISFLFRCTWELGSKNFIQKSCTQKVEMLYPFETRDIFKGEKKGFPHDLTVFVILCKGKY